MENTFTYIEVLSQVRAVVKSRLGLKYNEIIIPIVLQIERYKELHGINHFEAVKWVKENTTLMDNEIKLSLFSSALMDLIDKYNLKP